MAEGDEEGNDLTVDDIKKMSEIGPIKALLTPAAELLGQRLKASVEGWLESKAAENIEEHASKVLPNHATKDVSEQSQIELFEWAEKAGKVSPEETELSASIRAALKATLNGHHDDARILVKLTKPEILFLTNHLPGSVLRSDDAYARNLLEQKALVAKDSIRINFPARGEGRQSSTSFMFKVYLICGMAMMPVVFLSMFAETNSVFFGVELSTSLRSALLVLLPLLFAGLSAFSLFWPRRYYLTRKGIEIRDRLNSYLAVD